MATTAFLEKAYLAYFGRPVDLAGLAAYGPTTTATEARVLSDFSSSPESIALYGPTFGAAQVNAIYQMLFNRDAEPAGLTYWLTVVGMGRYTAAGAAFAILQGALNEDATAVANKLLASAAFAQAVDTTAEILGYNGDAAAAAARDFLHGVTTTVPTPTAVAAAVAATTAVGGAVGQTFTLTTGVDNITGGTGNDIFIGVSDGVTSQNLGAALTPTQTFGGLDNLVGGLGNDTLKLTNAEGVMSLATSITVSGIENLALTSANGWINADVQAWTGLTSVTVDQRDSNNGTYVDTDANVTSVAVKGGWYASINDNSAAADTLATVSLTDVTSNAYVYSDALATASLTRTGSAYVQLNTDSLTSLSLTDLASYVQVNSTAGTRALNVTMNELDGATVDDRTATSVAITASGANSTGVTLNTDDATTVTFAGDKKVSLAVVDVGTQSITAISSTNSAGVTITNALQAATAFAGGAGADSVILTAGNTKAITMGAGDDTVTMSAAVGTGGSVDAGDGTDTLKMSAADAATVSAGTTFEAGISNFEKVSIGQVVAFSANAINLANLDDISYVKSAGTAAGSGQAEVAVVTFNALLSGQTVTVGANTYIAASSMTAAAVAAAFSAANNLTGYTDAVSGTAVTFTASTVGNQTDLTASVAQPAAPTAPATTVTTQGVTAVAGVTETATVTFADIALGQTVIIDGVIVTATTGAALAIDIATAFKNGTSSGNAIVSGADAGAWSQGAAGASLTQAVFTSATANTNVVNLAITGTAAMPATVTVGGSAAVLADTEVTTMTFSALKDGQSAAVAGRIVTATGADLTAIQVADAFENGVNAGNAVVSGTLTGYMVGVANGDATSVLTAAAAGALADLVGTASLASAATAPAIAITQGNSFAGGGTLAISNMGANGTLELTDAVNGASSVALANSTGSADVLNIKLNGTYQLYNSAATTVAGVETINITTADRSTLTNAYDASTIMLSAADATTVTVTGNHGVNFSGSSLAKVTLLDASAVLATGYNADATAGEIGSAGRVYFESTNTTAAVTIKGGNGYDILVAATGTKVATIDGGAGNDQIHGNGGKDVLSGGTGNDWIHGGAAADALSGGTGNDTFYYGAATDSSLVALDVISDFQANTYGQGTLGAVNSNGATTDPTKLTGDLLDLHGITTMIKVVVGVFTNAADATVFLQNNGDTTTDTLGAALDSTTGNLYLDLGSDGTVDMVINLAGVTTLTAAAFADLT